MNKQPHWRYYPHGTVYIIPGTERVVELLRSHRYRGAEVRDPETRRFWTYRGTIHRARIQEPPKKGHARPFEGLRTDLALREALHEG